MTNAAQSMMTPRAPGAIRNGYFEWLRSDVLEYVPTNARRVLSVGCGAGVTEEVLVKKGVEVVGIELDHVASQLARERGVTVFEGDASKIGTSLSTYEFDCLIYADILEHIADPVAILREHVKTLVPGGRVIVSIPNFRYYEVFWQLFVRGHIEYVDAGILDRTHVRLTTRKMVEQWLSSVGLRPIGCDYRMSRRREKVISACLLGFAREFLATQVIVTGRKPML